MEIQIILLLYGTRSVHPFDPGAKRIEKLRRGQEAAALALQVAAATCGELLWPSGAPELPQYAPWAARRT